MHWIRRLILAAALIAGVAPAFAQVPPPVPALPDTERRTTYSITASTCACGVGFQLYGDSTDVGNWLEVFVNGVKITQSGNWTITSPTGPIDSIPRPITNAVLTFTTAQTGTVQIVGARRPRRASQFTTQPSARDFNQALTDIIAQNRETWDKINDVTGRTVQAPAGETLALLPVLASRANMGAGFDSSGNLTSIVSVPSTTFAAGNGILFTGTNPTTISNNIAAGPGITVTGTNPIIIGNNTSVVSIMDAAYGAKCNAVLISTGTISITSGTKNLTVTAAAFTAADVGKSMWVPGAGPASAGLPTTIAIFTDATHVIVADNASTTVTTVALTQASFITYGTDDTASINAAIAATPAFGTLFINPTPFSFPVRGCLIKQSGATGRSLLVDHPINILGGGNSSALITDPSMGSSIINIHALVSGVTWKGITWQGFLLGTDTNFTNFPRFGAHGIWFDATSAGPGGFQGINIGPNLSLGESGSGFYSLVLDGVGTQGNRIDNNFIVGGILLSATADSNQITNNRLLGISTFAIRVDTPAAGSFVFSANSTTLAAGVCILNGSSITVDKNFLEEQTASGQYAHGAQLDIGCSSGQSMSAISIHDNIITAGLSLATPIKIDANASFTWLYTNEIATGTVRPTVSNANATTVCGPNQFLGGGTHVSGTAPVVWGSVC